MRRRYRCPNYQNLWSKFFIIKSFEEESYFRDDPFRFLCNWVVIMALMFERLIFGGAHIEVLIKAWLILKVGLMDAQYWWAPRAQWLNKAQARAPVPSCTIYNRSAFFQLHHNNAAWWRSEWFGDSTIGLLNVFAKKKCPKARSNRPNTEIQDDERDQKSLLIYSLITAKISFFWLKREVIFPYQYFCPKLSATLLTLTVVSIVL